MTCTLGHPKRSFLFCAEIKLSLYFLQVEPLLVNMYAVVHVAELSGEGFKSGIKTTVVYPPALAAFETL